MLSNDPHPGDRRHLDLRVTARAARRALSPFLILFPFSEMDRHIKGPDALGMDPLDCPTGFAVRSFEVQYIVLAYAIGKTYQWGRIQGEHRQPVRRQSVEHG